jgi:iron complex outermembrane receptor protein
MKKSTIATLIAMLAAGVVNADDEQGVVIDITEGQLADPADQKVTLEQLHEGINADGGELLRNLPGVSGVRMGGHGIDPIIRGQSQGRLNILMDGVTTLGGCPNRMDPSTAYAPVETYDAVTVIKGAHTVLYGAGGGGGTVLFERYTEPMSDEEHFRGKAGAGYKSNSNTRDAFADLTAGNSKGYARAIAQYTDADNYEDGDGNEVRSAYNQKAGSLTLGYIPNLDTLVELGVEATREKGMLYAGAGMDAPESNNDTVRLKFEKNKVGVFNQIKGRIYQSKVDHVMDNYSLRPSGAMKILTDSTSDTRGGRITAGFFSGDDYSWTIGIDARMNDREAIRYAGMTVPPATAQSLMWPDVQIDETGVFGEVKKQLHEKDSLKMGLRYDRVSSVANKATTAAMGISPNDLYQMYYGITAKDKDDNNVSGFVRYEKGIAERHGLLFASLSQSVRSADTTEGYIAAANATPMMRWAGNPNLDPETQHQAEIGLSWNSGKWKTEGSIYYNDVSNYILRDRAHGQDGILLSDNATIYRNVDATLYGAEFGVTRQISTAWSSNLNAAYVNANNDTDDRPIAQTPPLEGSLGVDYSASDWKAGAKVKWATKQTRVDDNMMTGSALDAGQTPGYGVLDLYAATVIGKETSLKFGIDNVTDKAYAYHVNRANSDAFNPDAVQVNEPGRELWARISTKF